MPPLGKSDHFLIQLTPTYKPLIRRKLSSTRSSQRRSVEAEDRMKKFYRIKDWEMCHEDFGDYIEGLTQCVTDYIRFCEESVVPTKKLCYFSNNILWINRDMKLLLNRKKAFITGDNGIA